MRHLLLSQYQPKYKRMGECLVLAAQESCTRMPGRVGGGPPNATLLKDADVIFR